MKIGILKHYDRANADPGAELERHAGGLSQLAGQQGTPSPIHVRAVDVMSELMSASDRMSSAETPPQIRALMRMLKMAQPLMLERFATVDPSVIVSFMTDLRDKVQSVIDAGPVVIEAVPDADTEGVNA